MEEHNLAPLAELDRQAKLQRYGSISVTLEMHDGMIVGLQGNQVQRVKFKDGENTEATSLVLSEIKDLFTKQESGMFTFTMKFNKGNIKDVYLQRNLKKQYSLDKSEP
jgi:hypothetical protein